MGKFNNIVSMIDKEPLTFAIETYAKRSFNYYTKMVDKDGLPYFNIFWTEPAEAAHDWPDFGDVMPRHLQAVIMARHMTGEEIPVEKIWYKKIMSYIDPKMGLLFRRKTNYSENVADFGDQGLTLYTLVTSYLDSREESLRQAISKMVDAMAEKIEKGDYPASGWILKGLMVCARYMDYKPAIKLAELIGKKLFANEQTLFSPDNTFRHGGHMHSNLRILVGAADYALCVKDPVLYTRIDAIYRYVRSETTRFGFMPEVVGRKGDLIACETCAIMDYLGLAVTLANHGHPEYWGDVERVARNHLVESQAKDLSWLKSDSTREDTEQFTWRDIGDRMVGGYAGWSSPNHFLTYKETMNAHWGGPELKNKTRAFQNCCGGSGTHALFIVWKNASRFTDGVLSVNMHIDKLLPQAEIRSFQPYQGFLTIQLKESCRLRVRIPDFVNSGEVSVEVDKRKVEVKVWGNYLELGEQCVGENIEITYPLPVLEEEINIGNPGFRQYRYRVTWKGDTVIKMEPLGNNCQSGYSDFEKKEVPVFYGNEGPGQLYLREHMLKDTKPALSSIHLDDGSLDLWSIQVGRSGS